MVATNDAVQRYCTTINIDTVEQGDLLHSRQHVVRNVAKVFQFSGHECPWLGNGSARHE